MYARNVRGVAVELSLMIRPWSCNKKVIVKQQLLVLYKYSRQRQSLWLPLPMFVYVFLLHFFRFKVIFLDIKLLLSLIHI